MSDHRAHEYTQGICQDGAAILKDGQPMTVEEVLEELRSAQASRAQEGGESLADEEPLPCPFCGKSPHRMPHPDPSYPQIQCRNIECPIGVTAEEVSLESWNVRAHPPQSQGVPEGLEIAARHIERKADNYDQDHGTTDPSTGSREYPGDGAEYYAEMTELAEEVRALSTPATPGSCQHGVRLPHPCSECENDVENDPEYRKQGGK